MRNPILLCVFLLAVFLIAPYASAQSLQEANISPRSDYTGFYHPSSIAADPMGNIFVTDNYANSVWKFSPDGDVITHWGSRGTGKGKFDVPANIAIGNNGAIYITDINNNRIQKFSSDAAYISDWDFLSDTWTECNPKPVDPIDQCWSKRHLLGGIASGPDGNLYIVDETNNSILKASPDGTYLAKWGSMGTGNGQFDRPADIAVDGKGIIFVTDENNGRVQKFSPDGTFLASFGSKGSARGQFEYPGGISVDRQGFVYITEFYRNRVQKFTSSGTFVTAWGTRGASDGEFMNPTDVTVDGDGNVYVADFGNHRVQKFSANGSFLLKWEGSPAPTPEPTPRFECEDETWMNVTEYLIHVNEKLHWGFSAEEIRLNSEKIQKTLDKKYLIEPDWIHVCYSQFSRDLRDTIGISEEQRIALLYFNKKSMMDGFIQGEHPNYQPVETPHFVISGRITDPDGRPVPGAVVKFESNLFVNKTPHMNQVDEDTRLSSTTRTAPDGTYRINSAWGKNQTIRITKEGYTSLLRPEISLVTENNTINFQMVPETGLIPAASGFTVIPALAAIIGIWLIALWKRDNL